MTISGKVLMQDFFGLADWSNVRRYDGMWKGAVEDGLGREAWFDGASYCGQFKDGFRHGYGIYLHRSSLGYEKNFRFVCTCAINLIQRLTVKKGGPRQSILQ